MFSMKKKELDTAFTNLISEGTVISGDIIFSGVMTIQGEVHGDVLCSSQVGNHTVIVDSTGRVTSTKIQSAGVSIDGTVESKTIWCESSLVILANAKITGATIYYRDLKIVEGALLHECQLKHLDHCSEGERT